MQKIYGLENNGYDVSRKMRIKLYFHKTWKYISGHPLLYLMLIPGFFFLFIYKFWPLYGLTMAFKDYNIFAGSNPMDAVAASPWVGFK